jgi:formate hydrogenlyase subunit 6/NADH:ubiquinone oxidoreductase subunit I
MEKVTKAGPFTMFAPSDKCSGCLTCLLACSYFTEGVFSLTRAKLRISRYEEGSRFMITFLPNCIKCGLCADYCPWDAIVKVREKKEVSQ